MRTVLIAFAVLFAGCSEKTGPAPASTVNSEPEAHQGPEIEVRRFEVTPETLRSGQAPAVTVHLSSANPSAVVTLDWYRPDGWLAAHESVDTTRANVTVAARAQMFQQPGRYHAVLRSGSGFLAEDSVVVTRE